MRFDLETGKTEFLDERGAGADISPDGRFAVCMCARPGYPPDSWIVYPLERPNDLPNEPRQNRHPVDRARDRGLSLDREVEVAPRQPQPVAGHLHAHTRQHRQRVAPAGDGAGDRVERFHQDVTFATELHG